MQIDEMCIFVQEGVDRTGSQAYTVSHGKQMTADQSREKGVQTNDGLSFWYDDDVHVHSRKGYRTMNAVCFGMMMCMCMMRKRPVPAFLCAKYSA